MEGKFCEERRKFWLPAFFPFPTIFTDYVLFKGHKNKTVCMIKAKCHFHLCHSGHRTSSCFPGVLFNSFPNKPWFLHVCSTSLLKTRWEKEKLLVTSNFPFSHSVFYPFIRLSTIFIKLEIDVCKLFQFGRV